MYVCNDCWIQFHLLIFFSLQIASDGVSNLSFNGDSMNNSISNSTDLDYVTTTPLKTESRQDKMHVSTPKNFNNLSTTISNGNSSFKFGRKLNKSYVSDNDIKEENKMVSTFIFK